MYFRLRLAPPPLNSTAPTAIRLAVAALSTTGGYTVIQHVRHGPGAECVISVLNPDPVSADSAMGIPRFLRFRRQRTYWNVSRMVVRGRVELPTFRFSGGRSYRLSYLTAVPTGFEPATSTLTGWRALQTALQDLAL
jgi:hypothetical protein